ncbi:MAG: iron-containing alcohol dehydrogenase [Candidatus Nanopelagicales bacterium]
MAALTGLPQVLDLLAEQDPQAALVACELRELVVGPGALSALPDVVGRLVGDGADRPQVVLLVDETLIQREGRDVKEVAEQLLGTMAEVRRVVLSDGHSELHVTPEVVADGVAGVEGAEVVVALGGGTISDIGKLVVAERPGLRLISVMTAASVDGYTDNVSVMLKDGVKRTVPSVWPDVVLADAETVAEAPARMNRAGYGEMTSMYVAPADWRLAELLGIDPSYHSGPITLLGALADQLDACAPGVAEGEPRAVQELTWALALRGIATGVAGTSACLSGVEHLVSHMLDLRAAELGLPTGLHGEQVGVGSVIAACAWEMLHERLEAEPGRRVQDRALDAGLAEQRVRAAFGDLDTRGRIVPECWRDYGRKLDRVRAQRATIDGVVARWSQVAPELVSLTRPSDVIVSGLRAAGAPITLADLDVAPEVARWAVESCALMRDRFTVVDLLTVLGWWDDSDVDDVLARVRHAVSIPEMQP